MLNSTPSFYDDHPLITFRKKDVSTARHIHWKVVIAALA